MRRGFIATAIIGLVAPALPLAPPGFRATAEAQQSPSAERRRQPAAAAQPAPERLAVRSQALSLPEVELPVALHLPPGSGPFPVVIVSNSSAGAADQTLARAPSLFLARSIGVAIVDSFSPRGIRDTVADQGQLSSWAMASDVLAVAEALRRDGRVAGDRIAVMGQSKGGIVAYTLAFHAAGRLLDRGRRPLNAFLPLAPSCHIRFEPPTVRGPVSVVLAEKDDWVPPAACLRVFEEVRARDPGVRVTVIPGATHTWSTRGRLVHLPEAYTTRGCAEPVTMLDGNRFRTPDGRVLDVAGMVRHCEARGATGGGDNDQRDRVISIQADFLKSLGW